MACDDLEAALIEISENMVRNELDAIAIGDSALRRIEILEKIGERAKQGDNRYTDRGAVGAPLKTTDDIADEIGISERVLQENMQLAKGLIPEAKEIVRIKEVPKKIALKLSRLTPEQQQKVIKKRKITLSTLKEFLPSSTEEQGTEQRKRDSVGTGNVTKPCNIQPKSPPSDSATTAESSNSRQESIPVNESANANPASKPSELVEVDLSKDDFFNALNGFRQAVKYADDVPALFEKASQLADVKYKKEMLKELLDTTYSSFTSIAEQLRKQFGAELKANSKEITQKDKK